MLLETMVTFNVLCTPKKKINKSLVVAEMDGHIVRVNTEQALTLFSWIFDKRLLCLALLECRKLPLLEKIYDSFFFLSFILLSCCFFFFVLLFVVTAK